MTTENHPTEIQDWVEHRREDDGELVGFLAPTGDGFTAMTVFGSPLADPAERVEAERVLDTSGLSYLADRWPAPGRRGAANRGRDRRGQPRAGGGQERRLQQRPRPRTPHSPFRPGRGSTHPQLTDQHHLHPPPTRTGNRRRDILSLASAASAT